MYHSGGSPLETSFKLASKIKVTYQLPFTKLPVYNYQFQKLPNAKDTRYVWMSLHSWWEETFTEFLLHIMFYVYSLRIKRSHSSKEERDGDSLLIQIQCGIH